MGAIRAQSSRGGAPVFSLLSHALGSIPAVPRGSDPASPGDLGGAELNRIRAPAGPELVPLPKGAARPEAWTAWESYNPQARPSAGDFGRSEGHEPGPLHAAWFVLKQALQLLPAFHLGSSGRVAPGEFLCPQDTSALGFQARKFGLDKSPKQNSAEPDLRREQCKCSRGKGVQRSRETCYLTSKLSLVDPCVLILPWKNRWPLKISRCSYHGPLRGDGEGSAIPIPSGFLKPLGSVNQSRLYLKPKPLWFPSDARQPRRTSWCPSPEDLTCTFCPHCFRGGGRAPIVSN